MSATADEAASQPDVWQSALTRVAELGESLVAPGERVLVIGLRHVVVRRAVPTPSCARAGGVGETDAACASSTPRAGGTTGSSRSPGPAPRPRCSTRCAGCRPAPAGSRSPRWPASRSTTSSDDQLVLDFADERSVVQTRFPTTVLALARAAFGADLTRRWSPTAGPPWRRHLPADPADIDHLVFLGTGWTVGLAHEAALKVRETAQAYSESYPAMDFRHGPVAVAGPRSLVWLFGAVPDGRGAGRRVPGAPSTATTSIRSRSWCSPSGSPSPWPPTAASILTGPAC